MILFKGDLFVNTAAILILIQIAIIRCLGGKYLLISPPENPIIAIFNNLIHNGTVLAISSNEHVDPRLNFGKLAVQLNWAGLCLGLHIFSCRLFTASPYPF